MLAGCVAAVESELTRLHAHRSTAIEYIWTESLARTWACQKSNGWQGTECNLGGVKSTRVLEETVIRHALPAAWRVQTSQSSLAGTVATCLDHTDLHSHFMVLQ